MKRATARYPPHYRRAPCGFYTPVYQIVRAFTSVSSTTTLYWTKNGIELHYYGSY